MNSADTYRCVQVRYAGVANQIDDPRTSGDHERKVASAFGYNLEDLCSVPEYSNLGVSCGNPLATANIALNEVVIDLGSGGGIDVLLAAKKVGVNGKAIGIDMTKQEMLELARRNARKAGASNVSFIEAFITSIPIPSSTADCIISNCVVNLVPENEKPLVFQEMFRLLKPGGRVAISDILAKRELPIKIKKDLSLYVGCIAGTSQVVDYERYLKEAGFQVILDTNFDLNIYKETWKREEANGLGPSSSCCNRMNNSDTGGENSPPDVDFNFWTGECIRKGTLYRRITNDSPHGYIIKGSFKIFAVKPETHD
ncbi:UbiE/COQ5 family methyltransferase [Penicillium macrosclerotiorum]|uniref:UbiE/COQ5 family methyltransferase n=1 Tax=Penicillium macrosclerotiorum TaxID=303699 RepID=UPI0025485435|nr:UbiE/COQ5 family methyltransferase [Penicillium macrosclerotiorum]KAJ5679385.1 UbiE/COQ5 family methyltransferase [Penicillium macrosclerotiorum]